MTISDPLTHPSTRLPVQIVEFGGCLIVRPAGEVDSATVPAFRRAVADVPPGASVIVDLSRVPFMDSAGLGALVGAVRRSRESGGDFALVAPQRSVRRVLSRTGVDRLAAVLATVEDAVAADRR